MRVAAAAVAGLAAATGGTACNCDNVTMHARSPAATPGVAYPDTCQRGPGGAADFDGAYWRSAVGSVAPRCSHTS